jgi:hypothetical protein
MRPLPRSLLLARSSYRYNDMGNQKPRLPWIVLYDRVKNATGDFYNL